MRKARISCIQYQLRPIQKFDDFAEQVGFFVDSAEDYRADFVLLPEFFTTQLMSFLPEREPVNAIRHLAEYADQVKELLSSLAKQHRLHIVGGTQPTARDGRLYNTSFFVYPDGTVAEQDKIHITPAERDFWRMEEGTDVRVFETDLGVVGVAVCYDSEFPELIRMMTDAGAEILFVPSCTDDRHGYLRVRNSCAARAIENQMYVALTGTVGNLPRVEYMATNYCCAGIYTPCDYPFARDGIAAEGSPNVEMLVTADLDLELLATSRASGTVRPFRDRRPDVYRTDVARVRRPGEASDS